MIEARVRERDTWRTIRATTQSADENNLPILGHERDDCLTPAG